jgi:tripartite-type tricarboxylate transporter receptor subunit TctC
MEKFNLYLTPINAVNLMCEFERVDPKLGLGGQRLILRTLFLFLGVLMRFRFPRLLGLMLGLGLSAQVWAQAPAFPSKPIKAIVPFAPGSATDQIGRAFAQKMSENLGQPIVVENRAGVNGMLGADAVAKSPADGYTILVGTNSTNAALKSLMKKLPYDQDTAFAPIAYLGSVPLIVGVNNDVPVKTLKELVAMAKSKPGQMTFASASTSQRVSTEMLSSMTDISMTHVPYKGGPAAMTDLIGGQVNLFTADFAVMLGLKDYELIAYFALFAPAGTPPEVINRLNRAANAAATDKDILERFAALGFETAPASPEALAQRSKLETAKWAKAIREAKIEAE